MGDGGLDMDVLSLKKSALAPADNLCPPAPDAKRAVAFEGVGNLPIVFLEKIYNQVESFLFT